MQFQATVTIVDGRLSVAFPSALLSDIGAGEGTVLEAISFSGIGVFVIGTPAHLNDLSDRLASLGLGVTVN